MDGVVSSQKYVTAFFNWIKPKDARKNKSFGALLKAVIGNKYSTFEKWQSTGAPQKEDKALLCFGASAQFHGTHIEKHFAEFVHFWNTFQEKNPTQPDFSKYKTETEKLLHRYSLIPTKQHPIEQYPFAAQLQRHFPSQDFEHKAKFDDIKLFIDTHSSGYVMIEDGTGTNKSRLAAYAAKTLYDAGQYQCIWHFNEMGSGHNRSTDLLRTLFSQLKEMYLSLESDRFTLEYERVLSSGAGLAAFYQTIFDQLACDEKFLSGKLVILIDALDEVSQSDPSRQESINALFLPQILINNVFIIVTSKSFERETYSGNKLEIRLSEVETCDKNEQTTTESRHGIDRVEGAKKWLDPYNFDALPLVGRKKEFAQLDEFIKSDGQFKIWAIVGPSGAGKTRLASQWAYEWSELEGWDRRFLHKEDRTEPEKWSNWIPDKPTLIIIDYMYGFEAVIQKLMNHRFKPDTPKIRLLLIDHVFSEPLHSDKRWGFSGDGSSLNRNEKYFFDTEPLDLRQTLSQEVIIKSIIAYRARIDKESDQVDIAHKYLKETQGAYHPLFAALVGDAIIKSGNDFKVWNRRELIGYYLSGDKRLPWKHEGGIGRWASHFIAAATARRGMYYSDLIKAAGNYTPSPEHFDEVIEICQKVVADSNAEILKPFEPDILGESFFLKFLQSLQKSPKYQNEFRQIFTAGNEDTQTEDAIEFIAFIQRLTRNLLNDDQHLKETQELWDSLFNFMNPSDYRDAEPIRWAVTAGLIDMVDALKDQFPEDKKALLLNKIDLTVFYHINSEILLRDSVLHTMRYFELTHKITEMPATLSKDMFALFDRYSANNPYEETPILIASFYGFNNMINVLIDHAADTEIALMNGLKAIMIASLMGHTKAVQCLLNAQADIHAIDQKGRTALMYASANNHSETIKLLLNKGADIHATNHEGRTALMWACENGHTETVKLLLDKGAKIHALDNGGRTALMIASFNGHIKTIRLLLNTGAEINATDNEGYTALMVASFGGHFEAVKLLLDKGATIDAIDNTGHTPLIWASMNGHTETVSLLLNKGANIHAASIIDFKKILQVCNNDHINTSRLLADDDTNINTTGKTGRTALMWASMNGHSETVRILLDRGAEVSHAMLMQAIFSNHLETVELLLDNGAEIDTALIWASFKGHTEIVKLLGRVDN